MRAILILLNIVLGLMAEAAAARSQWHWVEPAIGAITFTHLAYYFWRPPLIGRFQVTRPILLSCLLLATFGELVLSAVWGLYVYRVSVLPLFVPPGHVLLFLAGLTVVETRSVVARRAEWIVPLLAGPWILYELVQQRDWLSLPLFGIFLLCLVHGHERRLYAVMFVLALGLELLGTQLGAWSWVPVIPGSSFSSANPPIAAGVFYALLDLLTVWVATRLPHQPVPQTGAGSHATPLLLGRRCDLRDVKNDSDAR